jgi:DNA-binding protein HU-beta
MAKKVVTTKTSAKRPAPRTVKPVGKAAKPIAKAKATPSAKKAAPKAAAKAPVQSASVTTVTVKHLAASLAEQHDMPAKQATALLVDVFGGIVNRLKAGERIRIGGLGIIEVKSRPARMGRNPATGEAIKIKASKKIAFRAAKELKEAI